MKIESVQVGNHTVRGPLRVIATQPIELEPPLSPQVSGAQAILAGVTAGTTANYAWQGFQATNTLGLDDMAKLLIKNGVAPEHASTVAKQAMEVIRAEPTKALLVAVSAGGTMWAALEAGSKLFGLRVSALRKLVISVLTALLAVVGYHYLRSHGHFQ